MADRDQRESLLDSAASSIENKAKKRSTRRSFIKNALVSAVAVTTTAGVAKKTASVITQKDHQQEYGKDEQAAESALTKREYVLMSDREKKDLVRMFENNYRYDI